MASFQNLAKFIILPVTTVKYQDSHLVRYTVP